MKSINYYREQQTRSVSEILKLGGLDTFNREDLITRKCNLFITTRFLLVSVLFILLKDCNKIFKEMIRLEYSMTIEIFFSFHILLFHVSYYIICLKLHIFIT